MIGGLKSPWDPDFTKKLRARIDTQLITNFGQIDMPENNKFEAIKREASEFQSIQNVEELLDPIEPLLGKVFTLLAKGWLLLKYDIYDYPPTTY